MLRNLKKIKIMTISAAALFAAGFLLIFSDKARASVSNAVSDCLEIIIPSLFAFSALAVYLQRSGLYKTALKPFTFVLSKMLKTDEEICGLILLSNIGGYPVGASLLSSLVNENRLGKNDAARLMCCCFGSGPSFIIGMVGKVVFNSAIAGTFLFLSCFLSSLVMAAVVLSKEKVTLKKAGGGFDLSAGCFINSVSAAAKAMFSVCTMIVIFSVISAALKEIGSLGAFEGDFLSFGENAGVIFSSVLEVTRIKEMTAGAGAMPICAALLSFGGVCVALQITAIVGNRIPLGKFLLSRIPAAALSAGFSALFSLFLPNISEETIAGNAYTSAFSGNAALSVCLIAMCAILLLGENAGKQRGG